MLLWPLIKPNQSAKKKQALKCVFVLILAASFNNFAQEVDISGTLGTTGYVTETEIGDNEANYLKENECFIWAENTSLPMRHIIPEAQKLRTIFVKVPNELAENCDFPKHLFTPQNSCSNTAKGILNFYKSPTSERVLSTAKEITTCNYDGPFRAFLLVLLLLLRLIRLLLIANHPSFSPRNKNDGLPMKLH